MQGGSHRSELSLMVTSTCEPGSPFLSHSTALQTIHYEGLGKKRNSQLRGILHRRAVSRTETGVALRTKYVPLLSIGRTERVHLAYGHSNMEYQTKNPSAPPHVWAAQPAMPSFCKPRGSGQHQHQRHFFVWSSIPAPVCSFCVDSSMCATLYNICGRVPAAYSKLALAGALFLRRCAAAKSTAPALWARCTSTAPTSRASCASRWVIPRPHAHTALHLGLAALQLKV